MELQKLALGSLARQLYACALNLSAERSVKEKNEYQVSGNEATPKGINGADGAK